MSDNCPHERFQCVVSCVHMFAAEWEPDGVVLITDADLRDLVVAQVEMVCEVCGEQRYLNDDEWEIA